MLTNYATLTKHPNPLFNLSYELDVLIGPKLIVSLPITIGSVPMSLDDQVPQPTSYKNFALGPQNVAEPEETEWVKVGQFETYAPVYPVFEQGQAQREANKNTAFSAEKFSVQTSEKTTIEMVHQQQLVLKAHA